MSPRFGHCDSDSVAAYVLGACPPEEAAVITRHLAACDACTREAGALRRGSAALLTHVPPASPPPHVKDRLMSQVRADASLFDAARVRHAPPSRVRDRLRSLGDRLRAPLPVAALGSALALALGGGLLLSSGQGPGSGHTSVVAAQVDRELAPRASGALALRGEGAELEVRGLPAPEPGRAYQVWVRNELATPRPANATLRPDADGVNRASLQADLSEVRQVLVTSEPLGGSQLPTRPPLLRVDL